jgi:hypothetical protein
MDRFDNKLAEALDLHEDFDDKAWQLLAKGFLAGTPPSHLKRSYLLEIARFFDDKVEALVALLATPDGKALRHAYVDCARYMTHPEDAAYDWGVDRRLLVELLKAEPVPAKEQRWQIKPPLPVKRLREVVSGGVEMRQETINLGDPYIGGDTLEETRNGAVG